MPIAVMPTCTVEMTRTGSSMSRSAACAPRPPRPASAARLAVTTAYSPTEERVPGDQGEHRHDPEEIAHPSTQ
jgi:hypothetical protein